MVKTALWSSYRLDALKCALATFKATGVPLICSAENTFHAIHSDDIGIYLFIPKLAYFFNLSIETAAEIFMQTFFWSSLLIGFLGCMALIKNWIVRCIVIIVLGVLYYKMALQSQDGGVYLFPPGLIVMIIPWFLYLLKTKTGNHPNRGLWMGLFLVCVGLLLGVSQYIRSLSGISVLIFITFMLVCSKQITFKRKTIFLCLLFLSYAAVSLYFNAISQQRDLFLRANVSNYDKASLSHPFWHTAYIGLGYLPNPEGIEYHDESAFKKVKSINPNVEIVDF